MSQALKFWEELAAAILKINVATCQLRVDTGRVHDALNEVFVFLPLALLLLALFLEPSGDVGGLITKLLGVLLTGRLYINELLEDALDVLLHRLGCHTGRLLVLLELAEHSIDVTCVDAADLGLLLLFFLFAALR